ncbi:MAG: DUF4147 domain-containing protein [Candidatus Paceibacterota bacterium]|jgi:glycerate-2-kinase
MPSHWIKNHSLLARTDLRRDALAVAEKILSAIDTKGAVEREVYLDNDKLHLGKNVYDLQTIKRVFLCGVGKCALEAANEVEALLGERLSGGVVIGLEKDERDHYFNYFRGTHPLPSQANVEATAQLIHLLKEVRSDDLVIFIVSGGGSTLLCAPAKKGVSMGTEQAIFADLTRQGATIQELNTVRKHLSLARGGWLAQYAYPAQIATLIFSDVPGNNFGFVASGPFEPDETDCYKADFILDKYQIGKKLAVDFDQLIETPKDRKYFSRVKKVTLVTNEQALSAGAEIASSLGYQAIVCDCNLAGEAKQVGETIAKVLAQTPEKTVLLYGGETTVNIEKCDGRGGRNRELALGSLLTLPKDSLVLALASDGRDNGPIAGAIVDRETIDRAKVLGLDPQKYLCDHDSGEFFQTVGDEIKTGPTEINVADIIIAIKG